VPAASQFARRRINITSACATAANKERAILIVLIIANIHDAALLIERLELANEHAARGVVKCKRCGVKLRATAAGSAIIRPRKHAAARSILKALSSDVSHVIVLTPSHAVAIR
jgi:hypothetical protein